MMTNDGEYITERLLPEFIKKTCKEFGISYQSFSDDWVLRLDKGDMRRWVVGFDFDINSTAASSLSGDKVATYEILAHDDIPTIEHYLARSRALRGVQHAKITTLPKDKPIVVKPLKGAGGRGIKLLKSLDDAVSYLEPLSNSDWAISPWYDIVTETRLIILGDEILCAYEKKQPTDNHGLRMYNLGLGAKAVIVVPSNEILQLAQRVKKSISLALAVIDIATLNDGQLRVVEINEWVTMEYFARQSEEYRQIAQNVYGKIVERMFEN